MRGEYPCNDCDETFNTADGLAIHERREHGKDTSVPEWVSHE